MRKEDRCPKDGVVETGFTRSGYQQVHTYFWFWFLLGNKYHAYYLHANGFFLGI